MTELTELHAAGTTLQGADATDLLLVTDVSDTAASADGTSKAIRAQHVGRIVSGAGAPASAPPFIGAIYVDTTNDRAYVATDTASAADWDLVTPTVVGSPGADALLGFDQSAGADAYFTLGTGLSTDGTTLNAAVASDSVQGIVELATVAEADTGTDTTRAVTPAGLAKRVLSNPAGITGADAITNIVSLTQAEYDAITPNASTIYVITA